MTLTIELTPEVEERLKNRAKARGFEEVSEYAKKVLEDDTNRMRTFDEILAPFRENVEKSGISDDGLDELFTKARKEVFAEKKTKQQK